MAREIQKETCHPSHVTRYSDSSLYDEVCVNCGATDHVPGGWGKLAEPCPAVTSCEPQMPEIPDEIVRAATKAVKDNLGKTYDTVASHVLSAIWPLLPAQQVPEGLIILRDSWRTYEDAVATYNKKVTEARSEPLGDVSVSEEYSAMREAKLFAIQALKGAADGVDTLLSATPQPGEQWVRCEDQAPYFVGHYDAYSPSDGGRYPDAYWDGERWENEMDGFPIRGVTHYCTPVMPQPEAGEQWVRCEDRLPTEDDADCFGNVWASISSGEWVWIPWKAVVEAHMDDSLWMQTGLTRPKPPKGGEPGKDKSCKYCYGGITDGVGNGCTCPQPPKE